MSLSRTATDSGEEYEMQVLKGFNNGILVHNVGHTLKSLAGQTGPTDSYSTSYGLATSSDDEVGPGGEEPGDEGLDDWEVAELVAVEHHYTTLYSHNDGTEDDAGAVRGEAQLWTSFPDVDVDFGGARKYDIDDDSNDEIRVTGFHNKMDPADHMFLWKSQCVHQNSWANSTNGHGGGGSSTSQDHAIMNYRGVFGQGPLFEPGDTINSGAGIINHGIDAIDIKIQQNATLYFDVYEAEEQKMTDVHYRRA